MNGKKSINKISTKTARGGRLAMKKLNVFQTLKRIYKQSLYVVSALVLAVSVLVQMSSPAFAGTFTSQPIPSAYSSTGGITAANGLLWMIAVPTGGTIGNHIFSISPSGTVTDYNIATLSGLPGIRIGSIITGSDGNIWFPSTPSFGSNIINIGKLNVATGTVTMYSSPISNANNYGVITSDADGNIWYRAKSTGTPAYTYLLSLNPSTGVTTTVHTFDQYSIVYYTASLDGKIWMTDAYYHNLQSFTASGLADTYTIPTPNDTPNFLTSSSDGALWFTKGSSIMKFTTSGGFTAYARPAGAYITGLVSGPNGTMWFIDSGTTRSIGKITSAGTITEYPIPSVGTPVISSIAWGPDGAVWFTYSESSVKKIGRFDPVTSQTVSFTSTAPTHAVVSGTKYTPAASATSGLPVAITVDASSSSVCTIVSGVVSFQGAGTCTLNANQGGDADYNPAPQVQQAFTVYPVDSDVSVVVDCPVTATISTAVECTITIENDGPAAAENVSLNAQFSNSFTGALLSGGGTLSGQTITWSTASLDPNDPVTLTFNATASVASKTSFSAAVIQTNPDTDISNNIDQAIIVIS